MVAAAMAALKVTSNVSRDSVQRVFRTLIRPSTTMKVEGVMSDVGHWDCWGLCGDRHINRPEPNSTPERAMDLLLEKALLVFGEQDSTEWEWTRRS